VAPEEQQMKKKYAVHSIFVQIVLVGITRSCGYMLRDDYCLPAEKAIAIRKRNFLNKFCVTNNELCKVFTDHAKKELATLLTDI